MTVLAEFYYAAQLVEFASQYIKSIIKSPRENTIKQLLLT